MIKHRIAVPLFAALLAVAPHVGAVEKSMAEELREARIETQIATAFALNRHLQLFAFEIEVDGSTVVLSGSVEDAIEKDLAEEVARGVDGVSKVENRVVVEPDMKVVRDEGKADSAERDFATTVDDATITASVKSRLLWNRHTDGLKINVDTHRGVVTLRGTVATSATKALAERLTENTDGVRTVHNKLEVAKGGADVVDKTKAGVDKMGDVVSDSWITTRVKSSLLYSKGVEGTDIHVETRDGVVKLRGTVDNPSERELAIAITRDIRGVRDVDAKHLRTEQRS